MVKLQNNSTTLEQSKRLLELGVPADSADCYRTNKYEMRIRQYTPETSSDFFTNHPHQTPCWSVGRLNEIFKICSDGCIEIYDLDLEGTQIERAMQAFEEWAEYNWLDFSKLEDCA